MIMKSSFPMQAVHGREFLDATYIYIVAYPHKTDHQSGPADYSHTDPPTTGIITGGFKIYTLA